MREYNVEISMLGLESTGGAIYLDARDACIHPYRLLASLKSCIYCEIFLALDALGFECTQPALGL